MCCACEKRTVTQDPGSAFVREVQSLFKAVGVVEGDRGLATFSWSLDFTKQLFICPGFRWCFLSDCSLRRNSNSCCFTKTAVLLVKLLTDLVSVIPEPGGMCA